MLIKEVKLIREVDVKGREGKVELSAPWDILFSKLRAIFKDDPEVEVREYDLGKGKYKVELWVTDKRKAVALDKLMVKEFPMGNITVTIEVVCKVDDQEKAHIVKDAFDNNPIVKEIIHAKFSPADKDGSDFVMCSPTVIQFYADNITDPYGNMNLVPSDVMNEIFKMDDVYFTTEVIK